MKTEESLNPAAWSNYISNGVSFHAYFNELAGLVEAMKNNSLTGHKYAHYYPLNFQRIKRGIKTLQPDPVFEKLISGMKTTITWIIITEQWCGDAAQTLPLFYKLEEMSQGKITLKLIYRDQHPELIDRFLTNGGRSIPKLIQLNEQLQITGTWGPRPSPAQNLVQEIRSEGKPHNDALHAWYAQDRYKTLQEEVIELLEQHIAAESAFKESEGHRSKSM